MGLFPHYQAEPSAVYAAADQTEATAKPIASTRGAVLSRHAHAVAAASGTVQPPLSSADQQVVQHAQTVTQAAAFAGGCLRHWGDAITTYNTGVDGLNRRYDEASAAHFGQHAPSLWDYLSNGKNRRLRPRSAGLRGQGFSGPQRADCAAAARGADAARHPRRRGEQGRRLAQRRSDRRVGAGAGQGG